MDYNIDSALYACSKGDMTGLEWLYLNLFKYVCAVCYSVTGDYDLAADSAQDTFARLPDLAKKYRSGTNAKAYIFKIACYCAEENKRKFGKRGEQIAERGDGGRFEASMLSNSYANEILSHLNKKQRVVVVMSVYNGMTYAEIAEALGIHENTVASRMNAARKILKEKLEKEKQ